MYDIFSACFLGDLDRISTLLQEVPDLVNAHDPACALLPVTPIHHAVYAGHEEVVEFLFEMGAEPGINSTPLVRYAAGRGQTRLLRLLLKRGTDASRTGCGRWGLDQDTSALLMSHGADVNCPEGAWVWTACTGNNSQRDDPRYVQALLDPESTRYCASPQALHYASKAGFTGVMEVLLKTMPRSTRGATWGRRPCFRAEGRTAGEHGENRRAASIAWDGSPPGRRFRKTPWSIARRMRHPDAGEIIALFDAASSRQTA